MEEGVSQKLYFELDFKTWKERMKQLITVEKAKLDLYRKNLRKHKMTSI
jgi:hypothetical protein